MLQGFPGLTGVLVVIATFPGLLSWWRGRALGRLTDDPALPERLLAARKRNSTAFGAAVMLLLVLGLWRWMWLFQSDVETRFRAASLEASADVARSQFDATCFGSALERGQLLCSAFDGTRTRFLSIDPASRRVAGAGWMTGRFYATSASNGEWVAGWHEGSAIVVNLLRREAIAAPHGGPDRIFHMAATDRVIATVAYSGAGSAIKMYRLDKEEK